MDGRQGFEKIWKGIFLKVDFHGIEERKVERQKGGMKGTRRLCATERGGIFVRSGPL